MANCILALRSHGFAVSNYVQSSGCQSAGTKDSSSVRTAPSVSCHLRELRVQLPLNSVTRCHGCQLQKGDGGLRSERIPSPPRPFTEPSPWARPLV